MSIKFKNGRAMYDFIDAGNDLYSKSAGIYVFSYNDAGALCYYNLTEEEVADIVREKSKNVEEEYWGAFLGAGGRILDNTEFNEYRDSAENALREKYLQPSLDFCEEHYALPDWVLTQDAETEVWKNIHREEARFKYTIVGYDKDNDVYVILNDGWSISAEAEVEARNLARQMWQGKLRREDNGEPFDAILIYYDYGHDEEGCVWSSDEDHELLSERKTLRSQTTEPKSKESYDPYTEIRNNNGFGPLFDPCGSYSADDDLLAGISIDAWKTDDDNEPGTVLANVLLAKTGGIIVDYHDNSARCVKRVQEAVAEARKELEEAWAKHVVKNEPGTEIIVVVNRGLVESVYGTSRVDVEVYDKDGDIPEDLENELEARTKSMYMLY